MWSFSKRLFSVFCMIKSNELGFNYFNERVCSTFGASIDMKIHAHICENICFHGFNEIFSSKWWIQMTTHSVTVYCVSLEIGRLCRMNGKYHSSMTARTNLFHQNWKVSCVSVHRPISSADCSMMDLVLFCFLVSHSNIFIRKVKMNNFVLMRNNNREMLD